MGWQAGATSYVYWPDGKVKVQVRTNHVSTNYEYNERGMIRSVQHRHDVSGRDLEKRTYWRDERDRIVAWKRGTDNFYNGMEDGRGNRYKYDAEGQLERAWYRAQDPETEHPGDPKRGDEFHYDALGNREGQNRVANRGQLMTMVRRDNGLNQYLNWSNDAEHPAPDPQHWGSAIWHDDNMPMPSPTPTPPVRGNGVTRADGYITANYNALNQPVGMWSPVYNGTGNYLWFGYDPLGRCVKRWKGPASAGTPGYNPATYFYYDGSSLVQEGSGAGNVERVYVHGGRVDEIVASQVSGIWYNHHYDAQGNCILLSNVSGGLQEQYDYDAFGYPYFYTPSGGKGGNVKTRFLFTGREWISDMRIYDYRARMYQPELGRFLQPDPQEFAAGDYNLYRYCHNDPVNKNDPTGMREQAAGEIMRDRMWDFACRMDSGNSFQGSYGDFMNRSSYLGVDDAGGGNRTLRSLKNVAEGVYTYGRGVARGVSAVIDLTGARGEEAKVEQQQAIKDISGAARLATQHPKAAWTLTKISMHHKSTDRAERMAGRLLTGIAAGFVVIPVGKTVIPLNAVLTPLAIFGDTTHKAIEMRRSAESLHVGHLIDSVLTGGNDEQR